MSKSPPADSGFALDLTPYEGYWVALVRGRVVGVGRTAEAARRAAKQSRPREEPVVILVRHMPPPDECSQECP
ncbi:MAG: DUF5678 domain-containing protein [Anaerolineae bacterium]|nr:DUF5678 domain-containing protein [Anaerolineae bacterium]